MHRGICRGRRAAAALLLAFAAAVQADGIAVAPVRLDLASTAKAEVLSVTNHGSTPSDVQVRVLRWSQSGNDDSYAASDDMAASPPRFLLAPGAEQTVRIYRRIAVAESELSYRIFIDQLPQGVAEPGVVRLPIRLVIPLFVAGSRPGEPVLDWTALRDGEQIRLRAHNRGTQHVRIASLALSPADAGTAAAAQATLLYVLPGASREIVLARPLWLNPATRSLRVAGDSDAGGIDARVELVDVP
ncbi:fimbrial chaperone protein [Tahibacter aquaticus]|uniref:Fimbrial chaperone protein n=1 Tax=Tahibacter aquaticus TaxID=520092 RepID=A0A4R6YT43_9GAMM|nr:fimbria/pilus periplasmic chaperone [Tahibacter aquaticus]TDR41553.1 fimbrial chaperone protein [Tahibacter aquaticus]